MNKLYCLGAIMSSFLHAINIEPQRVMGVPKTKLWLPLGIREQGSVADRIPGGNRTYCVGYLKNYVWLRTCFRAKQTKLNLMWCFLRKGPWQIPLTFLYVLYKTGLITHAIVMEFLWEIDAIKQVKHSKQHLARKWPLPVIQCFQALKICWMAFVKLSSILKYLESLTFTLKTLKALTNFLKCK